MSLFAHRAMTVPSLVAALSCILSIMSLLWPEIMALSKPAGFVLLIAFAWFHGVSTYGARRVLYFLVIVTIITNISENLSISTGFPFGYFEHLPPMGPKLFQVPLMIGPLYFAMGYTSWIVASIVNGEHVRPGERPTWTIALTSAFIATGWDALVDPIGSTLDASWKYVHPGGYYGVPFSNFLGWLLTTFTFFVIGGSQLRSPARMPGSLSWVLAPLFMLLQIVPAVGNFLIAPDRLIILGGRQWRSTDIYEGTAIVGLLCNVAFASIAIASVIVDSRRKT